MDVSRTQKLLQDLGYAIAFRRQGWTECLIWARHERWLGRGADEAEAFADATRQMLPSRAARRLLAWWVASGGQPMAEGPDALAGAAADAPGGGGEAEPFLAVAPPVAARAYGRTEALEALDLLSERIDTERAELALMTPARQRMVMLAWICRARGWEDRRPGDSFVARQVAAIARKITTLGKLWWPGSVRSLHVHSTPLDAAAEAGVEAAWPPRDWSEAAELVDLRLRELLARDAALGRDEYGWADAALLAPRPADPAGLLGETVRWLEAVTGTLEEPARARSAEMLGALDKEDLSRWARRLRWLRGAVTDFDTWGGAMGRLRWLALQLGARDAATGELLDPDYAPPRPWAEMQSPREDAVSRAAAGAAGSVSGAGAGTHAPTEALVASVRDRTSGLRALFVATTDDPAVKARLEETLGLSVTTSDEAPAHVQSEIGRIEEGSYDLLVAATEFRSSPADSRFAHACRRANIPYVRVYRGRTLACARAIAREMGIAS